MKYFLILLTLQFTVNISHAQTAEDSVKQVIQQLFTGMREADTSLIRKCFADSMIMQTISKNKEGQLIIRNESPVNFIDFIAKEAKGNADERIKFDVVKTDGPLAIAWTPYTFYYKGQFSHCGVNSFQLIRFNGNWKIQYLIDTRRRQGCE
ncbi:MAG TPA: nuclear transport factor 2 family protein [Chitinophagaceae bacterium]|nr:nuclear transport factor 2 family protein [Chitinophagaceae bacterium]